MFPSFMNVLHVLLIVVLFLNRRTAASSFEIFKQATNAAAEDFEDEFVLLSDTVIAMARSVAILHEQISAEEMARPNKPNSIFDLSLYTTLAGCEPFAVDKRETRTSEVAVIADDLFTVPDSDTIAWARAPNGSCYCQVETDAWNALAASQGITQTMTCERMCGIQRYLEESNSLDSMIRTLSVDVFPWVSAWYFTMLNEIRIWVYPTWSLASYNMTFQDMVGCTPNPLWWVAEDVPDGITNWTLPPYTDLITFLPSVSVAASAFTSSGKKVGGMFVDITLPSLHELFENVSMPIDDVIMLLMSKDGSLVACQQEYFGNLTGNVGAVFPEFLLIANGSVPKSGYISFMFGQEEYIAIGKPFNYFDCVFIAIAPKEKVFPDNSLVLGLAIGIPLPFIIAVFVIITILAYCAARLKRRVDSLQNELVTVKASDLLGTPADEAIKRLLTIKERKRLREEDRQQISKIVSLIACNKLYKADYSTRKRHGVAVDADVDAYINDQLVRPDTDEGRKPDDSTKYRSKSAVMKLVTPRTAESMKGIEQWDFDVTTIQSANILEVVGIQTIENKSLIEFFEIDKTKLGAFLLELQKGYFQNPYHSSLHAADVTQSMSYLLSVTSAPFTEVEQLAALIAALIHDYRHPGVNNNFLVNTRDQLALRYNCVSVLENMHASEGMQLLSTPEFNFLSHLPNVLIEIYNIVVQMVLATDMSRHIEITSQFAALLNSNEFDQNSKVHRLLLLKMFMKISDISNPTRPWQLCKKWSERVMDEFFAQGDQEKKLGIPVSPFMDRDTTQIAKCQSAFLEFVCIPSTELIAKAVPEIQPTLLANVKENLKHWKEIS